MIKLIIFDLDGVLVDTRDIHKEAFQRALEEVEGFRLTDNEYLELDGLPTKTKLDKLSNRINNAQTIANKKRLITDELTKNIGVDTELVELFQYIRSQGIMIGVASNAIMDFVHYMIGKLGINNYINAYIGNDHIKPKPHPQMYLTIMSKLGFAPDETLICEDSVFGKEAALRSGAFLCPIKNRNDLTIEKIKTYINQKQTKQPWKDDNMQVLIPMAGAGSRFAQAGYTFPKPLIEVNGKPMIQLVVENINIDAKYIFIVQEEHYEKYNLEYLLKLIKPNCKIVLTKGVTEGAACTTLLAEKLIGNGPLLIANSDQYVEWNSSEFCFCMQNYDAGLLTFSATHPKWSFARVENNLVVEVAEKKPISDIASVGIYYWNNGDEYVKYAKQMINKNIRVNNEFYVCPVLNEAIQDGKRVKNYHIENMWGLGTPEDLNEFNNRIS